MLYAGEMNSNNELSVALPVRINGKLVTALNDSGAGPSVIDFQTVCNFGLESQVVNTSEKYLV